MRNRHALGRWRRGDGVGLLVQLISGHASLSIIDAHASVQEAAFFDRAARHALVALGGLKCEAVVDAVRAIVWASGGEMGNGVWAWVLDTDIGDAGVGGCTGLAHGIVAAVEIFALLALEHVLGACWWGRDETT